MTAQLEAAYRSRLALDYDWHIDRTVSLSTYQGQSSAAVAIDHAGTISRGDLSSLTKRTRDRRDARKRHDLDRDGQPKPKQPHKAREWTPERREKQRQAMLDHHTERRLSQTKMARYLRDWRAAKRRTA